MVIPRTLTEEAFKSAPTEDQSMYAKGEDGSYNFVGENAAELRRGKTRVAAEKEAAMKELDDLKSKFTELESLKQDQEHQDKIKTASDAKTIDEAWKTKHTKEIQAREEQIHKLKSTILNQFKNGVVSDIASQIALPDAVDVVKLIIQNRIKVTIDNKGNPVPIVFDDEGQETRDSIKDLTKELEKDKRYERIMKGADVGSGATRTPETTGLPQVGDKKAPVKPSFQGDDFHKFMTSPPSVLLEKVKAMRGRR